MADGRPWIDQRCPVPLNLPEVTTVMWQQIHIDAIKQKRMHLHGKGQSMAEQSSAAETKQCRGELHGEVAGTCHINDITSVS